MGIWILEEFINYRLQLDTYFYSIFSVQNLRKISLENFIYTLYRVWMWLQRHLPRSIFTIDLLITNSLAQLIKLLKFINNIFYWLKKCQLILFQMLVLQNNFIGMNLYSGLKYRCRFNSEMSILKLFNEIQFYFTL